MRSNQIVCPGFIDLSTRLREPGQSRKATFTSETVAAASAGVTTMCLQPDTSPVIDTPAVAELDQGAGGKSRIYIKSILLRHSPRNWKAQN